MNRIRLYLHRLFRRPVITDPMRIYTRRLPDGVALDMEEYFAYVVATIADDEELLAQFLELVDDRASAREHKHDGWEPERLLMEKLATGVGCEVRVRGKALAQLADRLRAAVPARAAVVPAQRREGGAAA
ncbi:hypothetical protein [Streptomyces sp. NPDC051636]|uniref:hypothetical protein n=1 Tax=Streptomyces sp. NPDC051636 TaxID=3365663 RepID=UPI00378B12BD